MKPWMRDDEIAAIEKVIAERKPSLILEWGAGGSTVHFSKVAQQHNPKSHWVAIEHDPAWASKVLAELVARGPTNNVHLFCTPASGNYVTAAMQFLWEVNDTVLTPCLHSYDLMIVDGIERNTCLHCARGMVSPKGAVLLHDSSREQYKPALAGYLQTVLTTGDGKHQGLTLLQVDPNKSLD